MELSDESVADPERSIALARLEQSLWRALATTESAESRYHIRSSLQFLAVVREPPVDTGRPADASSDGK